MSDLTLASHHAPRPAAALMLHRPVQAQEVCRKLSLAHRPATVFVTAFRQVQAAVELIASDDQASHCTNAGNR